MAVALIYQGGLALYYRKRTPAVEAALRAPLVVPTAVPPPGDYMI
jgi:hypothetical protein